jgi:hypothetical protein
MMPLKNKNRTLYIFGSREAWGKTMATPKQRAANKTNAQRSTGPRTEAGKTRSRVNSRKHGLTAKLLVIGDEDPAEFEQLRAALMEQYDPQRPADCELVEYLAGLYWRLRRVPLFEAAIFAARQAQVATEVHEENTRLGRFEAKKEAGTEEGDEEEEMSDAEWLVRVGRALIKDSVWNDALGKLARHETTLMNALGKTLILLDEISDERQSRLPTINLTALPSAA